MMKLRAYGLIGSRCSRATGRRRRCWLIDLLLSRGNDETASAPDNPPQGTPGAHAANW